MSKCSDFLTFWVLHENSVSCRTEVWVCCSWSSALCPCSWAVFSLQTAVSGAKNAVLRETVEIIGDEMSTLKRDFLMFRNVFEDMLTDCKYNVDLLVTDLQNPSNVDNAGAFDTNHPTYDNYLEMNSAVCAPALPPRIRSR